MYNLYEPFTVSSESSCIDYVIDQIKLVYNLKFNSIQEQIDHVVATLQKVPEKSMVMKLFLLDYLGPYLDQIVKELTKLNFKFIVMTREDPEAQLLSFGIAVATDCWNSHDRIYKPGYKVHVSTFVSMEWLSDQIFNFDNRLNLLNINPLGVVRYTHAVEDLSNILNLKISPYTDLVKQIQTDPYELIENSEEVKEFIKKLLNGTQIH